MANDEYERRKRVFAARLTALARASLGWFAEGPVRDVTWGELMELFAEGLADNGLQASELDANRLAMRVEYVGDHLLDPDYASDVNWEVLKLLYDHKEVLSPYG